MERLDPSKEDTEAFDFIFQSDLYKYSASHGGEDVPIYAAGPWSHLFYTTHEQVFVASAMSYAAGVGPFSKP